MLKLFRKPSVLVIKDKDYRTIKLNPGDTYILTIDIDMYGNHELNMSGVLKVEIKFFWDGFELRRMPSL